MLDGSGIKFVTMAEGLVNGAELIDEFVAKRLDMPSVLPVVPATVLDSPFDELRERLEQVLPRPAWDDLHEAIFGERIEDSIHPCFGDVCRLDQLRRLRPTHRVELLEGGRLVLREFEEIEQH